METQFRGNSGLRAECARPRFPERMGDITANVPVVALPDWGARALKSAFTITLISQGGL